LSGAAEIPPGGAPELAIAEAERDTTAEEAEAAAVSCACLPCVRVSPLLKDGTWMAGFHPRLKASADMPLTFLRYKVDAENRELTYAFANVYLCTVGDEEKFSTLAMPVRERNDAHVLRSYKHFLDLKKGFRHRGSCGT